MEYKKCKDESLESEHITEFSILENIKEDDQSEQNIKIVRRRGKKEIFVCTYHGCKMKFEKPSKFKTHLCTHTGERQFVCNVDGCDKAYLRNAHLKRHKLSHKSNGKKQFPCKFCDEKFSERHNLKRHCSVLHEKMGCFTKTCEECSLVCPTRNKLKEHMIEVHNRQLYVCHICSKSFHEPCLLRRHLKSSVHQELFVCEICKASFNILRKFNEHKKIHIDMNKDFTCDFCGKKFLSRAVIIHHLRNHEKRKNFFCSYDGCNQGYEYQRNLDAHIRLRHKDIKFQCELCPRKLSTKQKLIEHITKIHENPTPRKPPPTKENRNARWDINIPKKSAVSKLCGINLPPAMEKIIINRHNEKNEL